MATEAITKLHKEGRLVFKLGDKIEYTDKGGLRQEYRLDDLSFVFWFKMNDEIVNKLGIAGANLVVVDYGPKDIEKIILKLKEDKS